VSGAITRRANNGASSASPRRGAVRRVPLYSDLPLDLPITKLEIHMVLDALGSDITTLFEEDE